MVSKRLVAILGLAVLCGGMAAAATALARGAARHQSPGELSATYVFDLRDGVPIEGFVSYIVLRRKPGGTVFRAEMWDRRTVTTPIIPGRYRISAYQRICSGNCSNLEPPDFGCGRDLTASSRERVRSRINVKFGPTDPEHQRHCQIRFR
jgi:hypothetical protein